MSWRLLLIGACLFVQSAEAATKVDPLVAQRVAEHGRARVIVVTRADPADAFGGLSASSSALYLAGSLGVPNDRIQAIGSLPAASAELEGGDLARLAADPNVVAIALDVPVPPTLHESIPLTHANVMHASGLKGTDLSVAVLDTGIDATHPAFAGAVLAEACFSLGGLAEPGIASLCPNGLDVEIRAGAAGGCPSNLDGCAHGTHVAGIIAGKGMHSEGHDFVGVAPGANIVAVQVFTRFDDPSDCPSRQAPCVLSYSSDQMRALDWILKEHQVLKVAAINMSLGGGANDEACDTRSPLTESIERLRAKGIPTVIAAGNDAYYAAVNHPGCISSAVTVAATDKRGELDTRYTNVSPIVDFAAPGTAILSAAPGAGYVRLTGTSMATPHIAGAFALLRQKLPQASALELEKALRSSSVQIIDPRTDTALMRMDFGGSPQPVAASRAPSILARPKAIVEASLSDVSGGTSRRFIVKQAGTTMTSGTIAAELGKDCTTGACDIKQIAKDTWLLRVKESDNKTSSAQSVESMLSKFKARVYDESELMSAPTRSQKED